MLFGTSTPSASSTVGAMSVSVTSPTRRVDGDITRPRATPGPTTATGARCQSVPGGVGANAISKVSGVTSTRPSAASSPSMAMTCGCERGPSM